MKSKGTVMPSKLYFYHDLKREPISIDRSMDLVKAFPNLDWGDVSQVILEQAEQGFSLKINNKIVEVKEGQIKLKPLNFSVGILNQDRKVIELSTVEEQVWISGHAGSGVTVEEFYNADFVDGFLISRVIGKKDEWILTTLTDLYINGQRINQGVDVAISHGMEVAIENQLIKVYPEEIHFFGSKIQTDLPERESSRYDLPLDFPNYHRSPRMILRSPDNTINLASPEQPPKQNNGNLLRMIVPPLAGIAATIGIGLAIGRGWLTLLTAMVTTVTMIFTVSQYFSSKKQFKQDKKDRKENYEEYLRDKVSEIWGYNQQQRLAADYHFPDMKSIGLMIDRIDSRIFEKSPQHFDFLNYRLGLATVPTSLNINYEQKSNQKKDAIAIRAEEAYESVAKLQELPIPVDLMHGVVGYIGNRRLVIEQLQLMLLQVATFHSYHDIEFVLIFPEEEKSDWWWSRWLKHTQLKALNIRGFIYNQRSRDQILGSLNTILKERKNAKIEAGRQEINFSPHIIILITDQSLIMDHVIMELLQDDPSELNVSLVYVEDVLSNLRENVKTVIDIRDSHTGNLIMKEGIVQNTFFEVDHFPKNFNKERAARNLGGLNHLQNLQSTIPDRLNFLQMYGVETVEELNIKQRWETGSPRKTMAVPIGWRAENDIVYLNLHEKADGPHGLLAGTTGSGKTEVIKDLITSLAVNFRPEHVAFLPIDFKGGALANDLKLFPHTLGSITNLDASSANRALASIQAEMKRRQKLFTKAEVSNINDYHTKADAGEKLEPIPHLIMISDEFAELKSQMPDFLDQLISVARVGRSLGVHLILATQKPAGVVNDQIWANSRFKIALKVADTADSKEILKTPDAADITQTGRGYLQVGNNEKYELFQTAYSGAPYKLNHDEEDSTLLIYQINELGQPELLNPDLSKGNDDSAGLQKSQMEAIVDYINEIFERDQYVKPAAVWLPPLENYIKMSDLQSVDFRTEWKTPGKTLSITLGLMDIPTQQIQRNLVINLSEDGHLCFFGSSGYGKSTALQTAILDVARHHHPDDVQMYIFDFGTNGLAPIRTLPHVKGFYSIDQEDDIRDWISDIQLIIEDRKSKLAEKLVSNTEMFYQKTGVKLPDLLIVIDAYEAKRPEKWDIDFDQVLLTILRSGSAIGIHVILNASRINDIRSNLLAGIKDRFMFFLNDDSDKTAILGRTREVVPDIIGRGLVRLDGEIQAAQIAVPVDANNSLEILDKIEELIKDMQNEAGLSNEDKNLNQPNKLRKQITSTQLERMPDVKKALSEGKIVLGTNNQQEVLYLHPEDQDLIIVSADDKDQLESLINNLKFTLEPTVIVGHDDVETFNQNTLPRLLDGSLSKQTILFYPAYQWLQDYDSNSFMIELGIKKMGTTEDGEYIPTALFETDNKFIVADIRGNFAVGEELKDELSIATTKIYSGDWDKRIFMDSNSEKPGNIRRSQYYVQIDDSISIVNRIKIEKNT